MSAGAVALILFIPKTNHDVIESRGICTDFFCCLSSNVCVCLYFFLSCVSVSIFKFYCCFKSSGVVVCMFVTGHPLIMIHAFAICC